MNYNLYTYLIYAIITMFITIKVGYMFYSNGEVYLKEIFNNDMGLIKAVNNILLIAYYLVNLGAVIVSISFWETVKSFAQMTNSLSYKIGAVMLLLAFLHFFNMYWVTLLRNKSELKQTMINHKI